LICSLIESLTSESVEGAALALESVDDIHGCDGLAASMLSVGDGVADHVLQEGLEDSTGLFVDHGADTLDSTTASETTDGRLGDALNVVPEHLAMTLGSALS